MHPIHREFIRHVKSECRRHKITIILSSQQTVSIDGIPYGGYFDEFNNKLVVSSGSERWIISTLVHEFSHMEQWLYSDPTYTRRMKGGYDGSQIMDDWLDGKQFKKQTVKNAFSIARDCELNCEIRSVDNIKKYDLQLDIDLYNQEANAYILSFNYIKKYRKHDLTTSPLQNEIVNSMPKTLDLDYTKLTREHELLFKTYLT